MATESFHSTLENKSNKSDKQNVETGKNTLYCGEHRKSNQGSLVNKSIEFVKIERDKLKN